VKAKAWDITLVRLPRPTRMASHHSRPGGEQHTNLAKFSGLCSILDEHELWNNLSGITRRETSVTIKIVFSKTLEIVEWKNARLVKENIAEEISQMRQ
jgi:hypothetical protein